MHEYVNEIYINIPRYYLSLNRFYFKLILLNKTSYS